MKNDNTAEKAPSPWTYNQWEVEPSKISIYSGSYGRNNGAHPGDLFAHNETTIGRRGQNFRAADSTLRHMTYLFVGISAILIGTIAVLLLG